MSKIMLVGVYPEGRGAYGIGHILIDTGMDPESARQTMIRVAKEYIIEDISNGGDALPYSYNFGDVMEMADCDPNFVARLASNGIRICAASETQLYAFDLDDTVIFADEVNRYCQR